MIVNLVESLTSGLKKLAWGGGSGFPGSGSAYNAASAGRRLSGWNGSILGPNTISIESWMELIRRSRDAIRNTALGSSAVSHFVSNHIGTGIVPHFTHPNPDVRAAIQSAWDQWVKTADFNGQRSFYGLQSLACRELFEAGEVFCRFHITDRNGYLKLQLIETEQVPVWINQALGPKPNTYIKLGIIFNQATDERTGYHIYKGNPYDSLVPPVDATRFIDIDAEDMIQVLDLLRVGQIRGYPMMAPVLTLLNDLEGYSDAERMRKRVAAMFALFIEKPTIETEVIPSFSSSLTNQLGVDVTKLEPGTINDLLPGEKITSPEIPQSQGYQDFMAVELHKFAAACKITYEMLTGDMKGVNYSSARVALLEFRRMAEQFQLHVIEDQFCEPILKRWMKEAVMSGALDLPSDYADSPEQYEACIWVPDGWQWVDPVKEVQSAQMAVRSGFISRSQVIRQSGFDPATIDAEIALERKREDELGIITDTNANVVLIGRETQPVAPTTATPDKQAEEEASEDTDAADS